MSRTSPSTKRKMTRQLACTVTAQKPEIAFKGMKVKAWDVHIRDGFRSIQTRQNVTYLSRMLANQAAGVAIFVEALQSFMAD